MSIDISDPRELTGAAVTGRDGDKLGKVDDVYLDNATERPEWAAVKTGLFGTHVSLVPLATAEYQNGTLTVPFTKDEVQQAPHHDPGTELSVDEEKNLFNQYGVSYSGDTATARDSSADAEHRGQQSGRHETGQAQTGQVQTGQVQTGHDASQDRDRSSERTDHGDRTVGHDTSGPTTDNAMTRSEEELHVGTETRESGRARLRKYVVTEQVTQTVPVAHEEVRVQREPITDANASAAHDGPGISEEEHEVVLHEERPVVSKETVAKERVRLDTETVREERQISEEVRKEQIDIDSDAGQAGTSGRETDETDGTAGRGR